MSKQSRDARDAQVKEANARFVAESKAIHRNHRSRVADTEQDSWDKQTSRRRAVDADMHAAIDRAHKVSQDAIRAAHEACAWEDRND